MRSFIIAMGILLVVLCIIVGSYGTLKFLSHKNVESMKEIYELVTRDNWQEANRVYDELMRGWGKHKSLFTILIDHAEMDAIELCLITAGESLKTMNKHDTLDAVAKSIFLFGHIEERNRFSYENVL